MRLWPAVHDALLQDAAASHDAADIRQSMREVNDGQAIEAGEFFDALRDRLLRMKSGQ